MPTRCHSLLLLGTTCSILATAGCRDAPPTEAPPAAGQGLEGFFNPQPGEVWTYAVTRTFAPGTRLRPTEESKAVALPNGAKRITFERRRICAGPERPEGAEKDLTAFELHEDGLLAEREFYDISPAGLIGRGWTSAPEVTPAVTPPPEGVLLTPGVTIALPRMVAGQSWSAPGVKAGPIFNLDVIENTKVSVPAGVFEATRIRLTTGGPKRSTKRTLWFAENIGIVQEEVAHYGAGRLLVKEHLALTNWSLPSEMTEEPATGTMTSLDKPDEQLDDPPDEAVPPTVHLPAPPAPAEPGTPPAAEDDASDETIPEDTPDATPGDEPDPRQDGTPDNIDSTTPGGDDAPPSAEEDDPNPPRAVIISE